MPPEDALTNSNTIRDGTSRRSHRPGDRPRRRDRPQERAPILLRKHEGGREERMDEDGGPYSCERLVRHGSICRAGLLRRFEKATLGGKPRAKCLSSRSRRRERPSAGSWPPTIDHEFSCARVCPTRPRPRFPSKGRGPGRSRRSSSRQCRSFRSRPPTLARRCHESLYSASLPGFRRIVKARRIMGSPSSYR